MTPEERDREIAHRYARAIVVHDVHEGRDHHGMTIDERRRFSAWQKAGCSVDGAIAVLLEDQID
jgi:hypothetical protein